MSAMSLTQELRTLASVDLFKTGRKAEWHVGRPFAVDFTTLRMVSNDKRKARARVIMTTPEENFSAAPSRVKQRRA